MGINHSQPYQSFMPQQSSVMPQQMTYQAMQNQSQNMPLLPQPKGNVYVVDSLAEGENIPIVQNGISTAISFKEGFLLLKTLQKNEPVTWLYNLVPYKKEEKQIEERDNAENIYKRITSIEEQILTIKKQIGGKENESTQPIGTYESTSTTAVF